MLLTLYQYIFNSSDSAFDKNYKVEITKNSYSIFVSSSFNNPYAALCNFSQYISLYKAKEKIIQLAISFGYIDTDEMIIVF
jgi:hypothetical protein